MKIGWWSLIKLALSGGLALLLAGMAYLAWALSQPIQQEVQVYEIASGSGVGQVARDLAKRGVLKEPYALIVWSYLQGTTRAIHAGEYRFDNKMTLRDVYNDIVEGNVKRYTITIVEGWTFAQMTTAVQNAPKLAKTLPDYDAKTVMTALGHQEQHPEGRFFPDTYVYTAGTTDVDLFKQSYQRMSQQLSELWAQYSSSQQVLKAPYEALILASIIEKETRLAEERGLVSGVFHNRLRKGMRLQTDPTVIYGLGEQYSGNLTRTHLRTDHAYNTYTRHGLPPSPIALPGSASLKAALQPTATQAIYFVAKPDGSHVFSDTLQQHNQAVIKYQLGGKAKPFSSYPHKRTLSPGKLNSSSNVTNGATQ